MSGWPSEECSPDSAPLKSRHRSDACRRAGRSETVTGARGGPLGAAM
eukprot:COSAG04_NODE_26729_length_291_cov_1.067708_1_plen_46_part_10